MGSQGQFGHMTWLSSGSLPVVGTIQDFTTLQDARKVEAGNILDLKCL